MLKVLIADDEPIARDILMEYVSKMPMLELVGVCANAIEAFSKLNTLTVDLLLLDINMPEMTGVDLLRALKNPPMVIFTTAYAEYAVESYELNAVDYLLKPISFERFVQAINKAVDLKTEASSSNKQTSANTIFVKSEGKLVKVELDKLLYIEGVKDYVKLWQEENYLLVLSTMKNMESLLEKYEYFLRVHKSYIINLLHVTEVEGNMLRMGKHTALIGNTYKEGVLKAFDKYRLS
ncbi:MAG: LytTR family DNA-binding domain-containing protein [Flavipsychrobacter sp.]